MKIYRERTAIRRRKLSVPARLALVEGVVTRRTTVLDYGCGRGDDVRALRRRRIDVYGWDPYFTGCYGCNWEDERGNGVVLLRHDVVLLTYVLNVIERRPERNAVLRDAYELSRRALVVSVRVGKPPKSTKPYRDGVVTRAGTFQRYFSRKAFVRYVSRTLRRDVRELAPGVVLVSK